MKVLEAIGPAKAALQLGKDSSSEQMRRACKELLGLCAALTGAAGTVEGVLDASGMHSAKKQWMCVTSFAAICAIIVS